MQILTFAIDMERDGETYYRRQAARCEGGALQTVFALLADEEAKHAEILTNVAGGLPYALEDHAALTRQMDLFRNAPDFQSSVRQLPDQAELYQASMEIEKKSIALYEALLGQATDDVSRRLFTFLVKEERDHYAIMEELYRHVNRPKDWVEAAEFGVREEY
ncbi:MAG: ferritin family protein [Clostridiales bacterium]|nr:ferritin family protein [Clostridiales bacterium]